jgi:hypothetical protein
VLDDLAELSLAREPADRPGADLVVALGVREVEAADRLLGLGAALAVVAASERLLPERRQREAQPAAAAREQEEQAEDHRDDRVREAGGEIAPGLFVAAGEQARGLGEAGEDVGMERAERRAALEVAAVDHAVFRAEGPALEVPLDVVDARRGDAIDEGVEEASVGSAVVVDHDPVVEHALVGRLPQAGAVEEDAEHRLAVAPRELPGEAIDARSDALGELGGDDRFELFETAAHARTFRPGRNARPARPRARRCGRDRAARARRRP